MEDNYKFYIEDLVKILLAKLNDSKKDYFLSKEDQFIKGQIMAYYDTLDLIRSQAESFNLNIENLEDVNLERYLFD